MAPLFFEIVAGSVREAGVADGPSGVRSHWCLPVAKIKRCSYLSGLWREVNAFGSRQREHRAQQGSGYVKAMRHDKMVYRT